MLSPKITLYYKQKNTHASIISGILSIIAYSLIISFTITYFIRYINKENPIAYFFNRYIEDIGTFSFKDNFFFNYMKLINVKTREPIQIDFDKIEIIGTNKIISDYSSDNNGDYQTHWIYGKCDEEIDISNIKDLLDDEGFDKSACLKKYYNKETKQYYNIYDKNFEWPSIKHGASHINVTFFGVIIKRCTNTTFRLNNFGPCSSEDEINNYLNDGHLSFNIIDHYIDILNYENPITRFLYPITQGLTKDSYVTNNLNFNPGLIKTYDNLFSDKHVEKSTYFFHENSKTTTVLENTNIICSFYIWMQNSQQYYERRYQKLQDALSDIGGIANLILIIAQCINYLIARYNMLVDTQELLKNIIKKNTSIYENLIKTHNPRKFITVNIQKKNEDNSTLKIFESNKNAHIINTDKTEIEKEENKKEINHKINVINSNNIEEETNRNKNEENIEQQNEKRYKAFEKLRRMSTRKFIRRDFSLINENDYFNCFSYFFYICLCKKINSNIKYYEELRRLIISEECMIQNYLNIYKLLEIQNIT